MQYKRHIEGGGGRAQFGRKVKIDENVFEDENDSFMYSIL